MNKSSFLRSFVPRVSPKWFAVFQKYPNAAHARPMQCKIAKGDALYLPAFWWHEVQSFPSDRAFNLAVNFW